MAKGTILIRLPATADNTTLEHRPYGKQPVFITEFSDCGPPVSSMENVICSLQVGESKHIDMKPFLVKINPRLFIFPYWGDECVFSWLLGA